MTKLDIKLLEPDDIKLNQKSSEVTDFDNPFYAEAISKIKEISINQFYVYAASAPQFGIMKRFIVIMSTETVTDINQEVEYFARPYFNPKIIKAGGLQYFWEACMSSGETLGKVARPYYIEIEAQDINGDLNHYEFKGIEAIIFCHEIDHLDGIRFPDKALELLHDIDTETRIAFRKEHPIETISETGEFNQDHISEQFRTKVLKKV